jgi:hypothetical protein
MSTPDPIRIDRRQAIKWIMAAGAGAVLLKGGALRAGDAPAAARGASGYGSDPDLIKGGKPGDYWPLTLTVPQRRAASALSDIILPADARSPSASAVGITDFLDEWVSAPYPDNVKDRSVVVEGLAWIDAESTRRHGAAFPDATDEQRHALCEEISAEPPKHGDGMAPSRFFRRFRDLVAAGYYTTPAGMKEIGYVGNVPLAAFEGPPPAVIEKLGLSGEVAW